MNLHAWHDLKLYSHFLSFVVAPVSPADEKPGPYGPCFVTRFYTLHVDRL
jgi:hypothetical protein